MPFPTSPTDLQTATVNGISYQYSTATNSWTRLSVSSTQSVPVGATLYMYNNYGNF